MLVSKAHGLSLWHSRAARVRSSGSIPVGAVRCVPLQDEKVCCACLCALLPYIIHEKRHQSIISSHSAMCLKR